MPPQGEGPPEGRSFIPIASRSGVFVKSLSIKRASSALLAIVLAAVPALAAPNAAAEPAAQPGTAYSADPLPTTQINGVVWDQLVVGDVVYVTGQFTAARPAGAALGQNETPRANILAYGPTPGI